VKDRASVTINAIIFIVLYPGYYFVSVE